MSSAAYRDPRATRKSMKRRRKDTLKGIKITRGMLKKDRTGTSWAFTLPPDLSRRYIDVVSQSYSLGDSPEELADLMEDAVDYYVESEREHALQSQTSDDVVLLPHSELAHTSIEAAQLLSLVVLLGTEEQRARISEVIGQRGPETVLEFLAGQHGPSLDGVKVELAHPIPYGRLVKVIHAEPDQRPTLMAEFLEHWYNGSRKARWWGEHLRGPKHGNPVSYNGYWCFEAAAVTQLLNIDDASYRDNEYYPNEIFLKLGEPDRRRGD